jgi:hypothetical protein
MHYFNLFLECFRFVLRKIHTPPPLQSFFIDDNTQKYRREIKSIFNI